MSRLLLVEQSATQASGYRSLLEEAGHQTEHAATTEQAIDLLRTGDWDAVLTAYTLPGSNGAALCRTIKCDESLSDIPVVLLTASGDVTHVLESLEAGADGYIVKEGIRADLAMRIARIVDRSDTSDPLIDRSIEFGGRVFQIRVSADVLFDVLCSTFQDLDQLYKRYLKVSRQLRQTEPSADAPDAPPADDVAGPLKVLLAEDSVTNQVLAKGLLRKAGHDVTLARNGREAVACAHAEQFDVVLMDVQMPEMDGLQATRAIREAEQSSGTHLTILAMTANSDEADQQQCQAAGMDGFLTKPLRVDDMQAALDGLRRIAPARRD